MAPSRADAAAGAAADAAADAAALRAARTKRSTANGGYANTSAESSSSFLSLRTAPVRRSCLTCRALGDAAIKFIVDQSESAFE